jgi:hypothetical protein
VQDRTIGWYLCDITIPHHLPRPVKQQEPSVELA